MGETISFGGGQVPEGNIARLIRDAREEYEEGYEKAYKRIPDLCDALEEREQEVERLREEEATCQACWADTTKVLEESQAEVERLREELRVTRMERDHAWDG